MIPAFTIRMKTERVKNLIRKAKWSINSSMKELAYFLLRGRDYKLLNDYILRMNRLRDIEEILFEASKCLKDILKYDLFAFALGSDEGLRIWIDPRYYKESPFIDRIKADFPCHFTDASVLTFPGDPEDDRGDCYRGEDFRDENVISYRIKDDTARLYILPRVFVLPHQAEIIGIIARVLETVIDNYLNRKVLETRAMRDPLTGCFNRRSLEDIMERELSRAARHGSDLSVIMLDIDHFKDINDNHGHQGGDQVLRELAKAVGATLRKSDYLVRYGGEEFAIILPETLLQRGSVVPERVRAGIELHRFSYDGREISVTVSLGVSSYRAGMTAADLLKEADEMLYLSKKGGRNKVSYPAGDPLSCCAA